MERTIRRYKTDISTSSKGSRYSNESQDSQSTAPTYYSTTSRPSIQHAATDRPIYSKHEYDISPCATSYARSSTETYASTIASEEEDIWEEPDSYEAEYEVPEYREVPRTDFRPSNPSNFAEFFPTTKRLYIRHDDTTDDGNMNLRVDTETRKYGTVQLFHLRMQDLKKRDFSLRRYERSSGREVCHSTRKYVKPAVERPPLTKSVSNAFASIRRPDFKRTNSGFSDRPRSSTAKRQDSGYGSGEELENDPRSNVAGKKLPLPTNTTKLEFSNYAQVEVKRRGAKSNKRYEFEYWGYHYIWRRVVEKDGDISYHLYKCDKGTESEHAVAHILSELRSPSQVREEEEAGGWVPPCSMWISDRSLLEAVTDVCDVIVATGLISLVDDCIKRRFNTKQTFTTHVSVPLTPLKYDMEFITPRAMVEHMFKRRNSGGSAKEREQRSSPLRRHTNTVSTY